MTKKKKIKVAIGTFVQADGTKRYGFWDTCKCPTSHCENKFFQDVTKEGVLENNDRNAFFTPGMCTQHHNEWIGMWNSINAFSIKHEDWGKLMGNKFYCAADAEVMCIAIKESKIKLAKESNGSRIFKLLEAIKGYEKQLATDREKMNEIDIENKITWAPIFENEGGEKGGLGKC